MKDFYVAMLIPVMIAVVPSIILVDGLLSGRIQLTWVDALHGLMGAAACAVGFALGERRRIKEAKRR